MRRSIRLFGRSVPLWVLLVPTAVALAAFIGNLLVTGNVVGSSKATTGPDIVLTGGSCSVAVGLGTATCSNYTANSFDLVIDGVDNESRIDYFVAVQNNGDTIGCLVSEPAWPHGVSFDHANTDIGAAIAAGGGVRNMDLRLFFANIGPSEDLATTLNFDFTSVGCS